MLDMEVSQPTEYKNDMDFVRGLLAELLEAQSSPSISEMNRRKCIRGVKALKTALDAMEAQVLA